MKTLKIFTAAAFAFVLCNSGSAQAATTPGNYVGLFAETNGITHQSAGFIQLKVTALGAVSGFLLVDGDKAAFTGKTLSAAVVVGSFTNRTGKARPTLALVTNPLDANQIIGTISNSSWVAAVSADLAPWSTLNPTTNFLNTFTFALPGSNDAAAAPAGDSVAWITNSSAGFMKLGGYLADRSLMAQKVSISANGRFPLFVPAYKSYTTYSNEFTHISPSFKRETLGSLQGWVTITNASTPPVGTLTWIKTAPTAANLCPALATNYYPAGFTEEIAMESSIYAIPALGNWVLNLASGSAVMQDGNLVAPVSNPFTITNTATTSRVIFTAPNAIRQKLSFTPSNGRIISTFIHPDTGLPALIYGVALQDQNIAVGAFLGINQSGSMLLP